MRPRAQAGGYPSWTLGEDVRLGVELQRHGYTGYFLPDRLAVGEVPDTVRGVFMQRSRCA
jgi:cellulose synthase/poly-beta-1,6-N-acetylglucosamine synthase-like glycosyltransferase